MSETKNTVKELQAEMKETKNVVQELKGEMHIVKDVNMTTMLKRQEEIRNELKREIREMGTKISSTIEQYIQKHEVEHKRIEYQIANLEWKSKIC